jgi:hypothetical protein
MGKRKDVQMFLKNIEEDSRLSFCRTYDDCKSCGFYNSKKGICKVGKNTLIDSTNVEQVKKYFESWLVTHPKKLPYNMFKKIMAAFDVEDSWTPKQNIAWVNAQIKEFGYEVEDK